MNERVDTLGWDVVIGIPLVVANARINEEMALSNLSFDFDASVMMLWTPLPEVASAILY